jgi:hypothetical protein
VILLINAGAASKRGQVGGGDARMRGNRPHSAARMGQGGHVQTYLAGLVEFLHGIGG